MLKLLAVLISSTILISSAHAAEIDIKPHTAIIQCGTQESAVYICQNLDTRCCAVIEPSDGYFYEVVDYSWTKEESDVIHRIEVME